MEWTTVPIPYSHARRPRLHPRLRARRVGVRQGVGLRGRGRGQVRRPRRAAQQGRPPCRDRLRVTPVGARHGPHGARAADAARLGLPREGPGHGDLAGQRGQLGVAPAGVEARLHLRGHAAPVAAAPRRAARRLGRHPAGRRPARAAAALDRRRRAGGRRACGCAVPRGRRRPGRRGLPRRAHPALAGRAAVAVRPDDALAYIRGRTERAGHRRRTELGGGRPGDRRASSARSASST